MYHTIIILVIKNQLVETKNKSSVDDWVKEVKILTKIYLLEGYLNFAV